MIMEILQWNGFYLESIGKVFERCTQQIFIVGKETKHSLMEIEWGIERERKIRGSESEKVNQRNQSSYYSIIIYNFIYWMVDGSRIIVFIGSALYGDRTTVIFDQNDSQEIQQKLLFLHLWFGSTVSCYTTQSLNGKLLKRNGLHRLKVSSFW